jgi:threonyl-tRNA synthetase
MSGRSPNDPALPAGYDPDLYRIRHSAAHVLAQAVRDRFSAEGPVRLGIGPPIEQGFYYDFDLPRPVTEEDLRWLEARMAEIVAADQPFDCREVSADEARALFRDEPFKMELIDGLAAGGDEGAAAPITVYRNGPFEDLCRGPHLDSTGALDPTAITLLSVSGAYWRGDERRPMLQRIYGTAWRSKEELDADLWRRQEAERRDHRRIGQELELFHFEPTAPGMPYWLPKGLKLYHSILAFWREELERHGYQETAMPLVNDRRLWETSGHWDHYQENMFLIPEDELTTYGLKPMNCPNHMLVFNLKTRSYRDLPLRFTSCDMLHRHERSGTLHGLLRVQSFRQDDAHIFLAEEQIEAEYARVLEIFDRFYRVFGLSYRFRLGTRPDDFIGESATWDKAEAALRRILDQHAGAGGYAVAEGDGAFYGPKVDVLIDDAIGRTWQLGTIQLDFQLPRRFGCVYADSDGQERQPVVIHQAIYGSLERFIGILIEHTAGALPVWLAPVQARLIPIADAQVEHARSVEAALREARLRVEVDDSDRRMQAKIREAQLQKVPFMLVVGKREAEANAVAVRLRSGEDLGAMPVEAFAAMARSVVESKTGELTPPSSYGRFG